MRHASSFECLYLPLVATVQVQLWGGLSSLLKGWVEPGFTQDNPDTCVPLWCSSGRLWRDKRGGEKNVARLCTSQTNDKLKVVFSLK